MHAMLHYKRDIIQHLRACPASKVSTGNPGLFLHGGRVLIFSLHDRREVYAPELSQANLNATIYDILHATRGHAK